MEAEKYFSLSLGVGRLRPEAWVLYLNRKCFSNMACSPVLEPLFGALFVGLGSRLD